MLKIIHLFRTRRNKGNILWHKHNKIYTFLWCFANLLLHATVIKQPCEGGYASIGDQIYIEEICK